MSWTSPFVARLHRAGMVAQSWAIMHDKGASPMAQKISILGINIATCGSAHAAAFNTQGCKAPRKEGAMTTPLIETMTASPQARASAVLKLYQEGIIAGTCGAATIALWFLLLDILAGHPLSTPNMLGTALFKGWEGLEPPAHLTFSLGIVVAFTALHWLAFVLTGALASRLLVLAEHNPNLGFGVLLFFALLTGGFVAGGLMCSRGPPCVLALG